MLHKKVSEEKKISEAKSPFENSATAESVTSEIVFYNNMQVFLHNFFITNNPQTNKENNHFAFLSKEHQRELFKYLEPYQELARQTLHIPSSGKSKDIVQWMAKLTAERVSLVVKISENQEAFYEFMDKLEKTYPKNADAFYVENKSNIENKVELKDSEQKNKSEQNFKLDPTKGKRGFKDFLIMPIQRLPRYRLLTEAIIQENKKAIKTIAPELEKNFETIEKEIKEKKNNTFTSLNQGYLKIQNQIVTSFRENAKRILRLNGVKKNMENGNKQDLSNKETQELRSHLIKEERNRAIKLLTSLQSLQKNTNNLEKITRTLGEMNKSLTPSELFKKKLEDYKIELIKKLNISAHLQIDEKDEPDSKINIIKQIKEAKDFIDIQKILHSFAAELIVNKTILKQCQKDPRLMQEVKSEKYFDSAHTEISKKLEKLYKEIFNLKKEIKEQNLPPDSKKITEQKKKETEYNNLKKLKNDINIYQHDANTFQTFFKKAHEPQGSEPGPLEPNYKVQIRNFRNR